jgi:hypothetical protein
MNQDIKPENIEQNQAQVNAAQTQNTIQENQESSPTLSSDTQKENWKKFREQKDFERKQRIEAEKIANEERARASALQAALEAAVNKGYQQPHQEMDESEEQRLEKKVNALLAQKEAAYEKQRIEKEHAEFPQKLVSAFSDFNQVCSTENLDYLEYHYPELASPFKYMPDGFDKWASIYKAVKRFVPNTDSKKDMQKMEKNLAKPQSTSSPGNTQGGNAMPSAKLDEQKKADNWARMQKTLKGLS